jgi:uncharacterized NAD(P)/FAD-binding protein YdhS
MQPLKITIIGGGFCGIMTAINLLEINSQPLHIHIINKGNSLVRGIAYAPANTAWLLNVPSGKMGAFAEAPGHFLEWLKLQTGFNDQPQETLAVGFAPRALYGEYLTNLWQRALATKHKDTTLTVRDDVAYDIAENDGRYFICLKDSPVLEADVVVLATGNALPRLPSGVPVLFSEGHHYFGNPWQKRTTDTLAGEGDVLIIGNGLTMADTVVSLVGSGFKNIIYTVSPHGFNLNIYKEQKSPYQAPDIHEFINKKPGLSGILKYLNVHRKAAEKLGQSAFPLVDSLRPYLQDIWQSFILAERQTFMKYLRHLWGSARHRLPAATHTLINELYAGGRLMTYKGRVTGVIEIEGFALVTLHFGKEAKQLKVQRIINCTGPEGNPALSSNELLRNLEQSGLICADDLGMGVKADPATGRILALDGEYQSNLFALGSNLKGMLWESTSVPDLRVQAKNLAILLAEKARQHQLRMQDV